MDAETTVQIKTIGLAYPMQKVRLADVSLLPYTCPSSLGWSTQTQVKLIDVYGGESASCGTRHRLSQDSTVTKMSTTRECRCEGKPAYL